MNSAATTGSPGPILRGASIYLRPVTLSDVSEAYLGWLHDEDVTRYLDTRFETWTLTTLQDYVQRISADKNNLFLAIVLQDSGRHIGNIKLGPLNWKHRYGEIGLMLGQKDCWGKGYGTEAIQLLTDYAFRELKLHRVTASCYDGNIGSSRGFLKVGFEIEGRRKLHVLCDGVYKDYILMGKINPADLPPH